MKRGIRRWTLALLICAMGMCLPVLAGSEGVQWTGLEWNGDISGEVGERNCDIVQISREPARTDSIPYAEMVQARLAAAEYAKELSPYYQLLSQCEWKFTWYESPDAFDAGEDSLFYRMDFADDTWASIHVPSVWQTVGYDHPIYTNTTQKFAKNFGNENIGYPRDLPKAPTAYNPVGLYRKIFTIPEDWQDRRIYLDFEGVDAAFYVWVNGIQVGYAEDSFTTDEFDITDYVRFGQENLLAVKVYRWCDGSWLEDQDMFDLSGIFRDVYVYAAPQVRVRDFCVVTDFDDTYTDSTLRVEISVKNYLAETAETKVILHLMDAEGQEIPLTDHLVATSVPAEEERMLELEMPVSSPRKWSAEDPYLYTLILEEVTGQGTVWESTQVGFRKITYKENASGWYEGSTEDADLIRINGQPIMFRGVDRHETHPEYGYAISREVMEEDIRIMLENNINAVRTSHYPNNPYWYYLCDRYGIYVVDEANIECHSNMTTENERITEYLSAAIIDREYNMVRRDRNHACVVMWSIGNECKNPEILRTVLVEEYPDPEGNIRVLREYTADRPWHYEQAGEMTETGIDVKSGMYARVEELTAHGERDGRLPMIECEYEHAMGNSEGNFDEYWDAFEKYRNLQGGFIWDFIDQSIYLTAEDGTRYFGYGGDYGERVHDENFCANGLLLPDRTVQPEMAEVRYHYQQVKFEDVDASAGKIIVKNWHLFTDLPEKYELHWQLYRDAELVQGGIVDENQLHIPCVDGKTNQAGQELIRLDLDWNAVELRDGAEYFLNLSLCLRQAEGMLPAGFETAWEQFVVEPPLEMTEQVLTEADEVVDGTLTWNEQENLLQAEMSELKVTFDKQAGRIILLQGKDANDAWRDLMVSGEGPHGNFFRAGTDNDRGFIGYNPFFRAWKEPGEYEVTEFEARKNLEGQLEVTIHGVYDALNGLTLDMVYTVDAAGWISVQTTITPRYEDLLAFLPVVGLEMRIPKEFEQITWFGNGPEETYADRYKGTKVGLWRTTVTDNFFPYVQSSETGNHVGTRWVRLTDEAGFGLQATALEDNLEFSALHYTAEELDRAAHPYELIPTEDTVLRLNAVQAGVGGDDGWSRISPHEAYLPKAEQYSYGFVLSVVR